MTAVGATVVIERCEVDSYGSARGVQPERRSNIWLEQIPSVLIVRDSQGFAYAPSFGPPANMSLVRSRSWVRPLATSC
jgi:hypothetical protein